MMAAESVELGEQLDITVAAGLKERLSSALASGTRVELDGSRLQHADGAGIQLLVAFSRAAASTGWGWAGGQVPSCVAEAAAQLGLSREVTGDAPATGRQS